MQEKNHSLKAEQQVNTSKQKVSEKSGIKAKTITLKILCMMIICNGRKSSKNSHTGLFWCNNFLLWNLCTSKYTSTSFNNSDEIRIAINQSDLCLLPSKSSIHVFGRLLKADDSGPTATTNLVNNTICHLFEETSLIKGYLSHSLNQNSLLENANWTDIAETNKLTNAAGYFNISIPLSFLLGFAEDYNRVIINAKHELVLIRANNDSNAVIQTAEENYKITIFKNE